MLIGKNEGDAIEAPKNLEKWAQDVDEESGEEGKYNIILLIFLVPNLQVVNKYIQPVLAQGERVS